MINFCVFIPAFNASKTLPITLSYLNDSARYINYRVDVFIVDDFSSVVSFSNINFNDFSFLNVKTFKNKSNLGERGTINKYFDILLHSYSWAFLMHADDFPKVNWLDEIIKAISICNYDNVFTVWSSFDVVCENGNLIKSGASSGEKILVTGDKKLATSCLTKITASYHVSGAAFNLSLFKKINGFDASLSQFGDTVFFAEGLLKEFSYLYLSKSLTFYRISTFSVTAFSFKSNKDIFEIIYILKKYKNILSFAQILKIKVRTLFLLFKRICKYLIKGKYKNIFQSFTCFFKLLFV